MTHTVTTSRGRWRTPLAGLAAAVLAVGGAVAALSTPAYAEPETLTFDSPDGESWDVPAGVHEIEIEVVGAGAGIGQVGSATREGRGGVGARITGTIPVEPGETYRFYGATMGLAPPPGQDLPVDGNGGRGFRDGASGSHRSGFGGASAGGGGGGAGAIVGPEGPVVVAGGGGGGAGWGDAINQNGGDGGSAGYPAGATQLNGSSGDGIGSGAGGSGDSVEDGHGTTGADAPSGTSAAGGGGGGGGYLRGGAGGNGASSGGGGGGGAGGSYVAGGLNLTIEPDVAPDTDPGSWNERRHGFVTISYEVAAAQDTETTLEVSSAAEPGSSLEPGEPAQMTAQVTPVPPSGQVVFEGTWINGNDFRTEVPVDAEGVATYDFTPLNVGEFEAYAYYDGSAEGYNASERDGGTFEVGPWVTETTLEVPEETLVYGQTFEVEVAVTTKDPQNSGAPTGRVMVTESSGRPVGEGTLSDGTVTVEVTADSVGTVRLRAVYDGDDRFARSVSALEGGDGWDEVTIEAADTEIDLTADPEEVVLGQQVELTARVAPVPPGSETPQGGVEGAVVFEIEGAEPATETVPLDDDGTAELRVDATVVGAGQVSASFLSSSANFNDSSADEVTFGVAAHEAELELVTDGGPTAFGEPVELQATLTLDEPGATEIVGDVEFFAGEESLGSVTLEDGEAALTVADLPVGEHELRAVYAATDTIGRAESDVVDHEVEALIAEVALSTSPEESEEGEDVTASAEVTPAGDSAVQPTGSVQFLIEGEEYGDPVELNSTATVTVSDLPVGTTTIEAQYSGDAAYEAASATAEHTVTEVADEPGNGTGEGSDEPGVSTGEGSDEPTNGAGDKGTGSGDSRLAETGTGVGGMALAAAALLTLGAAFLARDQHRRARPARHARP